MRRYFQVSAHQPARKGSRKAVSLFRRLLGDERGEVVEKMVIIGAIVAIALPVLGILGSSLKDRADAISQQIESISSEGFENIGGE